jgi:adenosylcobyric acid synthase
MLGQRIADPDHVEQGGASRGLGYLNTETELTQTKCTTHVEANPTHVLVSDPSAVRGYQIHMGITLRRNEHPCFKIHRRAAQGGAVHPEAAMSEEEFDGAIRHDGLVWGTYIHGVFDQPRFRRSWLNRARMRKGLLPLNDLTSQAVTARLQGELDRWTDHLSVYLDTSRLVERFCSDSTIR